MGLFDSLTGALGGALGQLEAAAVPALSPDAALKLLSEHLPGIIDKASPNGALPS